MTNSLKYKDVVVAAEGSGGISLELLNVALDARVIYLHAIKKVAGYTHTTKSF
jgi:hypothetical protein